MMQVLNNKIDLFNFLCECQSSLNGTVLKLQVTSIIKNFIIIGRTRYGICRLKRANN